MHSLTRQFLKLLSSFKAAFTELERDLIYIVWVLVSHPSTHKADYTCRSAKELINHGLSEINHAEQKAGCCSHLTCGHWAFIHGKILFSVQSTRPWVTKHKSWSTMFMLLGTKSLLRNMLGKCQAMSYMWWNDMETMGFVLRVKWQNRM